MRLYSLLATLSLAILFSCESAGDEKEDTLATRKIVDKYFDHFNKHEWSQLAMLYSDSSESKDPSSGADVEIQTRAEIEGRYQQLSGILPDLKAQLLNVYPSGTTHIIVEFISTGTGPDGEKFNLPICSIFEIKNNMIVKDYSYYDTAPPGETE